MNIERISYEKVFPLGAYMNEKIRIDVSLEAGEDAIAALDTARNLAHEYHQTHAHTVFEDEMRGVQIREVEPSTPQDKIEGFKQVISMCTTLTALERFKLQVERTQSEELTNAYNEKHAELEKLVENRADYPQNR